MKRMYLTLLLSATVVTVYAEKKSKADTVQQTQFKQPEIQSKIDTTQYLDFDGRMYDQRLGRSMYVAPSPPQQSNPYKTGDSGKPIKLDE